MTVVDFKRTFERFLDSKGQLLKALPAFFNDLLLIDCYKMMQKVRMLDAKAIALQRTGKLGTYPSNLGQEAIGTGIGAAMQKQDVFCPYYRELGAQLWRGVRIEEVLLYWGGDERGSDYKHAKEDLPCCVPIASQTLHAVGIATAIKLKQQKRAVVVVLGDGATSRGDFYEAMNVAGVWKLPVVFVINNNQYAISVPIEKQTVAKTLAQKGIAAGIENLQIDGNDVIAVVSTVKAALNKAYSGEGSTVIEALTYRLCDHTTADDAKRYRTDSELKSYYEKEPIKRLDSLLRLKNLWDDIKQAKLKATLVQEIEQAVQCYIDMPKRTPSSMFDYLYETLPEPLAVQKEAILNE